MRAELKRGILKISRRGGGTQSWRASVSIPLVPGAVEVVDDLILRLLGGGMGAAEIQEFLTGRICRLVEELGGPGFQAGVVLYLRAYLHHVGTTRSDPVHAAVASAVLAEWMADPYYLNDRAKAVGLPLPPPVLLDVDLLRNIVAYALDVLNDQKLLERVHTYGLTRYRERAPQEAEEPEPDHPLLPLGAP